MYKSLLHSILTYVSHIWGYAADTYRNKLQAFQSKTLRIVTTAQIRTDIRVRVLNAGYKSECTRKVLRPVDSIEVLEQMLSW
jgi:hypothetical protein